MAVLMVGVTERERIAEVIAYAKANPVPLELVKQGIADRTDVLELKDRKLGFARPPSAHMEFPGGYRAAFSIEQQPEPVGRCSHLSISVAGRSVKGAMPGVEAVKM